MYCEALSFVVERYSTDPAGITKTSLPLVVLNYLVVAYPLLGVGLGRAFFKTRGWCGVVHFPELKANDGNSIELG